MAKPRTLELAWQRVKKDQADDLVRGDFVFDGLKGHRKDVLTKVQELLQAEGGYKTGPVAHLRVPKSACTTRPGSVLSPLDRIVYHWLLDRVYDVLEPHFPAFDDEVVFSYRYCGNSKSDRPFRGTFRAYSEASYSAAFKGDWVITTDLVRYFERIDHGQLSAYLVAFGVDPAVVHPLAQLIQGWAPLLSCGLPQSQDPSGYLASAFLASFDHSALRRATAFCRYTDDMTVVLPTREAAAEWLELSERQLWRLGLALNCSKTKVQTMEEFLTAKSAEQVKLERRFDAPQAAQLASSAYGSWAGDTDELDAVLAMVDEHDAFLELFAEEVKKPEPSVRIIRMCLSEFRRLNPGGALDSVLPNLAPCLEAGQCLEQYLVAACADDAAISDLALQSVANQLLDASLSDWQAMWALHCSYRLPSSAPQLSEAVLRMVRSTRRWAEPVAAYAMLLAGWDGDDDVKRQVVDLAQKDRRPWVQYGAMAGVQELNRGERNAFLKTASKDDPLAGLLANCLKQEAFAPALARRRSEV